MSRTYEGMFLIDNDAVRAGWSAVKASLAELVRKHGGEVLTARRWEERRLAYPIKHRLRATYLLAYFELPPQGMTGLLRDLEIVEPVLRNLILTCDAVPAKEHELAAAELAEGFTVPEPPSDDQSEDEPEPEPEQVSRVRSDSDDDDSDDDDLVSAGSDRERSQD